MAPLNLIAFLLLFIKITEVCKRKSKVVRHHGASLKVVE